VDDTQKEQKTEELTENEVFYTEGDEILKEARLLIAKYSLPRA
jgi:U4/U6 small nuclear ribonucleoprotein PRP4